MKPSERLGGKGFMQVVNLAGGYGTRISEENAHKPKPMVDIGERPILWHVMCHYATFGFRDFTIGCGYRGEVMFFANYCLMRRI